MSLRASIAIIITTVATDAPASQGMYANPETFVDDFHTILATACTRGACTTTKETEKGECRAVKISKLGDTVGKVFRYSILYGSIQYLEFRYSRLYGSNHCVAFSPTKILPVV